MKNKLLYILVFTLFFLGTRNVYAANISSEIVQSRSYKIDMVYEESTDGSGVPKLEYILSNTEKDDGAVEKSYYIILIKTSTSSKPDLNSYLSCEGSKCGFKTSSQVGKLNSVNGNGVINLDKDFFLVDGYEYAYVVCMRRYSNNSYKVTTTDSPLSMKKPNMPETKFSINAGTNSITVIATIPHDYLKGSNGTGNHTIVTKLGKVTDDTLISKLKKEGSKNPYSTLIDYVKKDENGKEWNQVDTDTSYLSYGEYEIDNGSLYYIYSYYSDSGSVYRNTEQMVLAVGKDGTLALDFDWDKDFSYGHKVNIILVFGGILGVLVLGAIFFYFRAAKKEKQPKEKKKAPNYTGLDVNSFDNLGQLSKPTPPPPQPPTNDMNNFNNGYNNNQYNNYNNNGYNNNYNNGYNNNQYGGNYNNNNGYNNYNNNNNNYR